MFYGLTNSHNDCYFNTAFQMMARMDDSDINKIQNQNIQEILFGLKYGIQIGRVVPHNNVYNISNYLHIVVNSLHINPSEQDEVMRIFNAIFYDDLVNSNVRGNLIKYYNDNKNSSKYILKYIKIPQHASIQNYIPIAYALYNGNGSRGHYITLIPYDHKYIIINDSMISYHELSLNDLLNGNTIIGLYKRNDRM